MICRRCSGGRRRQTSIAVSARPIGPGRRTRGTRTSSHAGEVPKPLVRDEQARAPVVGPLRPQLSEEALVGLRPDGRNRATGHDGRARAVRRRDGWTESRRGWPLSGRGWECSRGPGLDSGRPGAGKTETVRPPGGDGHPERFLKRCLSRLNGTSKLATSPLVAATTTAAFATITLMFPLRPAEITRMRYRHPEGRT